ncbi:MAG: TIGR01212 family radical SAM protein [Kosmotoga sp.]|uniref:TIGR01212 family radical SAM protein n=1 Tax=Kosmotoga arenicorallina TaxID=688066 RepID=A0A7C5E2M3_9BACT|nr:TIGR01212 family radical SAM protein [Kosmotoga sp.]MBO8166639.1 TIGR01212 family radical SAM protein [Kosmotoga sp.]MCD6160744.1 TIGR01212 family radical SAM protein [Kosmotoga sp.]HHF08742.1 TIGR01212 family radical SAM protein [Kosmotoga arenicorallina]
MNHEKPYRDLKTYLKERYGEPVYRLPIDAGFTCPNRDGTLSTGGCIYCDATGSGFSVNKKLSIQEQMKERMEKLRNRGIGKFMAYFQANSNTYAPIPKLRELYSSALLEDVIILDISTRPDLVPNEVLELLADYRKSVDVFLELGLQTVNYHTLRKLNRQHTLAEFVDAVIRAKKYGLEVIAHVILNLPWDNLEDVVETAKIISVLQVDGVKLHSLYVVKDTPLEILYRKGKIKIGSLNEFINRAITFLEYLDPKIVIHRLAADPPHVGTVFGNWGLPKIEILNRIEKEMILRGSYQGKKYAYLNR